MNGDFGPWGLPLNSNLNLGGCECCVRDGDDCGTFEESLETA